MAAPRTTLSFQPRSYETRADGTVAAVTLVRWFQDAAFANSTALGFPPERYNEMGVTWVMRAVDLEIAALPRDGEEICVTTWIPSMERVRAYREYEASRVDGTWLARCSTVWAMVNLSTRRATRIPDELLNAFEPAGDFALAPHPWPEVAGTSFRTEYRVPAWEEDQMAHVNNANYIKWVDENARRAALAAGVEPPRFRRYHLKFRLPARKDDLLTWSSRAASHSDGAYWQHEIARDGELLVRAWSIQGR